jgi:hypothetical protein
MTSPHRFANKITAIIGAGRGVMYTGSLVRRSDLYSSLSLDKVHKHIEVHLDGLARQQHLLHVLSGAVHHVAKQRSLLAAVLFELQGVPEHRRHFPAVVHSQVQFALGYIEPLVHHESLSIAEQHVMRILVTISLRKLPHGLRCL